MSCPLFSRHSACQCGALHPGTVAPASPGGRFRALTVARGGAIVTPLQTGIGALAQLGEREAGSLEVGGSIPPRSTISASPDSSLLTEPRKITPAVLRPAELSVIAARSR